MAYRSGTVATTENFFANTDTVLTTPPGTVVGDGLVAFLCCGSPATPDTPAGWDLADITYGPSPPGNGPSIATYTRLAQDAGGGSPPATYTFNYSGGGAFDFLMGAIVAYDSPLLLPADRHVDDWNSGANIDADHYTLTIPAGTTAADAACLYVFYVAQQHIPIVTPPAASTPRLSGLWLPADVGGTFTRGALVVAEEIVPAGATPSATFAVEWQHAFFGPAAAAAARAVLVAPVTPRGGGLAIEIPQSRMNLTKLPNRIGTPLLDGTH